MTPSCVGKCLRLTFSSDLEEAMFETGKSLSAISKFDSVIEKSQPIYINIFIFVMAIISEIIILIVIRLIFKGEKMQALVTNLAMTKGVKAMIEETRIETNYEYWIIIVWLSLILISIMLLTREKLYKMPIFKKYCYSNTNKIMMFLSNIKSYVPIKLCKTSGSIHLFKLMGSINRENVTLHRNTIWDIMEID